MQAGWLHHEVLLVTRLAMLWATNAASKKHDLFLPLLHACHDHEVPCQSTGTGHEQVACCCLQVGFGVQSKQEDRVLCLVALGAACPTLCKK